MMWCDVMRCDVMWCGVVCCRVMWCGVMWCDVTQGTIVWNDISMIWYGMVICMVWYGCWECIGIQIGIGVCVCVQNNSPDPSFRCVSNAADRAPIPRRLSAFVRQLDVQGGLAQERDGLYSRGVWAQFLNVGSSRCYSTHRTQCRQ